MKTIKVMSVFSTRPEAIKWHTVVKALERILKFSPLYVSRLNTVQMLDQVLSLFDIKPDHDLDIMQHGQTAFRYYLQNSKGS